MSNKHHDQSHATLTSAQACQMYLSDWKSGNSRTVEEVLSCVVPGERSQAFRSLLLMECRRRMEAGEKPSDREYLRRFPNEMAIIAEVLEMLPTSSTGTLDNNSPIEITGYGAEYDNMAAALRATPRPTDTSASVPKPKSSDKIPQPLPQSGERSASQGKDHSRERASDTREHQRPRTSDAARAQYEQTEEIEEVEAHLNPLDFAEMIAPDLPKKGGRRPIMKLVLDWAKASGQLEDEKEEELSPDSLFQKLVAKSVLGKSPLAKPKKNEPAPKLTRLKTSDPDQAAAEEPIDPKELDWTKNPILLSVLGVILVTIVASLLYVFVFSSAQPINLPPATPPATTKKAVSKESPPKSDAVPAATKKAGE